MENRPPGMNTTWGRAIMKSLSRLNVLIVRATGGRLGTRLGSLPVGLLNHVGRTSGRPRTTPLIFMRDGANLVVVASQGGLPENPQWYRNLMADPMVSFEADGIKHDVRARTASLDEKAVLWPRLVELYSDYASYQRWAERDIPVVILEPR